MKTLKKIIPSYAVIPIIMSLVVNMITYFGTRIFTTKLHHYNINCFIDDMIPFTTFMIWIYVLSYVIWVVGFIVIGRENKKVCYEVLFGEQIAKLMCLVIFVAFPTTLIRPEFDVNTLSEWMTNLIYTLDSPDNLFPSIHCLESWVCFRGAMSCKKVGKVYKVIMLILALLVFASTVMVKQHVFVDIIGAILVVEIGLALAKRLNIYKKLDKSYSE